MGDKNCLMLMTGETQTMNKVGVELINRTSSIKIIQRKHTVNLMTFL